MKKNGNISKLFALGLFTLTSVSIQGKEQKKSSLNDIFNVQEGTVNTDAEGNPYVNLNDILDNNDTSNVDFEALDEEDSLIKNTTEAKPAQSGRSGSKNDSLAKDLGDRAALETVNTTGTTSSQATSAQKDNKKQGRETRRGARRDARRERRMNRRAKIQENRQKHMNKRMERRQANTERKKQNIEWRQNLRTAAQDGNFDKVKELIKGHDGAPKAFKNNMLKAAEAKDKAMLLKLIEQRESKLKIARERAKDKRAQKKDMKKDMKKNKE